jgi:hypothetical protein
MVRRLVSALLVVGLGIWIVTIAVMFRAIQRFETTPGRAAIARRVWPAASSIHRAAGQWSLVMLVHPHCSCSRASVTELQAILDKAPASLKTYILVYRPGDAAAGWEKTDVVESASHLPRAQVIVDPDGREAKRFGGFTSGQTYLFDGEGNLRFSGGITSLRGHAGANRGRADVIQIVRSQMGSATHPVFGCAISSPKEIQ